MPFDLGDLIYRLFKNRELTESEHDKNLAILSEQIAARPKLNAIVSPFAGNALVQRSDGVFLPTSALNGGAGAVTQVNGKQGAVVLTATDVGAADSAALAAVSASVSGKADASTVSALATTVAGKADASALAAKADASALAAKADAAATTTALAAKADASALAAKADASALAAKADATATTNALALKASAADVTALTATVAAKADASALATTNAAVAAKADASALASLTTTVGTKAAAADVTALAATVAGKAETSALATTNAAVATKAAASDLATVAAAVAGKVNSDDTRLTDKRAPAGGDYGDFTVDASTGMAEIVASAVARALQDVDNLEAEAIAERLAAAIMAEMTSDPFPVATVAQYLAGTALRFPDAAAIRYMGTLRAKTYGATVSINLNGAPGCDSLIASVGCTGNCDAGFITIDANLVRQKGEVIFSNVGGGSRAIAMVTANGITVTLAPGVINPGLGSATGDTLEVSYTIISATAVRIDSMRAYAA